MRAVALLVLFAACIEPQRHASSTELHLLRERARGHQILSAAGLAVGVVTLIAGGLLAVHADKLRSQPSSGGDDEAGLGSLAGGALLLSAGTALTLGSGIGLAVSSHDYATLDAQIQTTR